MKKNLLMLLCAVSLLAHTVHADGTAVEGTVEAIPAPAKFAAPNMHDYEKMTTDKSWSPSDYAETGKKSQDHTWRGYFKDAYNTRPYAFGTSHGLRALLALAAADVAARDKRSLLSRGFGWAGNRFGFRRGTEGWRGRVARGLGGDAVSNRMARTALLLSLLSGADVGASLPTGDSSLLGALLSAGKRGFYNIKNRNFEPQLFAQRRRTKEEARKLLGLDVDPATIKEVVEDAGAIVPGLGEGFEDEVNMDSFYNVKDKYLETDAVAELIKLSKDAPGHDFESDSPDHDWKAKGYMWSPYTNQYVDTETAEAQAKAQVDISRIARGMLARKAAEKKREEEAAKAAEAGE